MTSLYRFRPLNTHTIDELKNSYLYFSAIDKLNDPMECFYQLFFNEKEELYKKLFRHFIKNIHSDSDKYSNFDNLDSWIDENLQETIISLINKGLWAEDLKPALINVYIKYYGKQSSIKRKINTYIKELKKLVINERLVCSFSKLDNSDCIDLSNNEILMWAHYAGGHSGICLEFSKIIAQDREFENDIEPKKIDYIEREKYDVANIPFSLGLVLSHIEHKYQFLSHPIVIEGLKDIYNQKCESIYHKKLDLWKYEQEHRISIPKEKLKNQKLEYKIECLKSITFGKRTPFDKQRQITNLVKNKKPNIAFYKVDIDENGVFGKE